MRESLRAGPLDIRQLAAGLATRPVATDGALQAIVEVGLVEVGLVEGVVLETGRSAWGLTRRGRADLRDRK